MKSKRDRRQLLGVEGFKAVKWSLHQLSIDNFSKKENGDEKSEVTLPIL